MNKDKRNNIQLLGTLNNADESGIIANANQVYDANEDKSTQDVSKEHKERIETLETKENSMQTTLENITKTGEASAASNVTYNHNDSQLDASNVQQAIDEVYSKGNTNRENDKTELEKSISDNKTTIDNSIQDVYKKSNYNDGENIIDFNTIHLITDNPEFVIAAVDVNDRILYGIKSNGQPYWGIGVPKVVRDYVDKQVNDILGTNNITETIDSLKEVEKFLSDFKNSDTLKALLDTKANKTDVVFDISAYHATGGELAKYADLAAALDSNNGGGVPQSLQKGGMSIKFIQSSDNKYVQARCIAQNFTTDVTQWQDPRLVLASEVDRLDSQLNGILPIIPEKTNFIELVRTANFFNKDTVVHGYYGYDGITYQDSDFYWCSDFIPVEEGKTYIRVGSNKSFYVYAYDEDKVPVVVNGNNVYWQGTFGSTPIPEGVAFVRLLFQPNKIDEFAFYDTENIPSQYVPYAYYHLRSDIRVDEPESLELFEYSSSRYGTSEVGNLDYQEIDERDYSQIIMYGQSLSMGWEAPEAILEDALPGVYMVGDKVAIGHGNNGQNVLNPLISTKATSCGENPTVGAMNAFAKMYKRFVSKEQKFIATSCGEGGKSIEQLSKECTNNGSGTTVANLYHTQFLTTLNRTKTTVDNLGKTVGCFAILFMQGEYNYVSLSGGGMTVGTDATNDKDAYKAYLLTLKNNMQADIMATYGQTKKPLFFIYEVAGSYINRYDMSINMAQIEFALENDDVFLLSPTYPVPDYGGGHLSTNGYRWYGEMMAKSLYEVFIHGKNFKPLMPEKFEIVGSDMKTIKIDFYVPVMPILFDAYTKEQITNQGFRVRVDDADVTISNVYIKENSVFLVMPSTLENKKVEVAYAGQSRSGSGNLRDSDTYHSLYTYYDDRESSPSKRENYTPKDKDGNYIYGLPYPMFNWCGNFYKLVQESNN